METEIYDIKFSFGETLATKKVRYNSKILWGKNNPYFMQLSYSSITDEDIR